jgi:hypothetical protein
MIQAFINLFDFYVGGAKIPKSGIHYLPALFALCFLSTALLAQGFESEINAFEQADLASPPPDDPLDF